ncbi:MAG: hypothetical protein QM653_15895 [Dysgonomonas sp.]|uniref:hypothetical protein n=1 Tax=Dysgonomonas sp. TaxID=1891233 RepID=UPI0039E4F176
MKNKLELKHIAPYLPYGLRAKHEDNTDTDLYEIIELNCKTHLCKVECLRSNLVFTDSIYSFNLLLKPLSDLYKEIDGEIPADILFPKEYYSLIDFYEEHNRENQIQSFIKDGLNWCETYSFWEYLLSKHFDVFSLIDKGLAIDLNTVKP